MCSCPNVPRAQEAVLADDKVRAKRILPEWSDTCVYLAVGNSGMCYNRDGKRTFLFCFSKDHQLTDTPQAREFSFGSLRDAEHFLFGLPNMRTKTTA
jgi:hypothetical protein